MIEKIEERLCVQKPAKKASKGCEKMERKYLKCEGVTV